MHRAALFWSKFLKTKIFKMWLGDIYCIVVNDSDAIKEVLYNSDFDGRPDIFLARLRDPKMERRGEFYKATCINIREKGPERKLK